MSQSYSNPNPAGWRKAVKLAEKTPHAVKFPPSKLPPAVVVAPSIMRKAEKLAPKIKEINTGIYRVGLSTISIWKASCTCQARRNNPKKPCVHQIALYLAQKVQTWGESGRWLMRHNLKYAADQRPQQIAIYTKIKGYTPPKMKPFKGGFYRISGNWSDGRYEITDKNGETWNAVYREDMHTLTPFFVENTEEI